MHINRKIEVFLRRHNMPATKFGRLAARDPRLVLDFRMGREARPGMCARLDAFMQDYTIDKQQGISK